MIHPHKEYQSLLMNYIKEYTERCRKRQGLLRESMGEPMGVAPWPSSKTKQVNMLVDGEHTGKNFVNAFTFNYANDRIAHRKKHETFDEYRLYNNMLSSQPMAFNLFCPFIQMLQEGKEELVSTVFRAVFPSMGIKVVTEVTLEFLPDDIENYVNDRTAMDVIVRYTDTDNLPSFIAIETKYTDVLGTNGASEHSRHKEWIKKLGMFNEQAERELISGEKPIVQIYRNFLLTESYGKETGAHCYYSVVLAPAQHPTTAEEVASLQRELKPEYRYKISAVTLECFVETALSYCTGNDAAPFVYFKDRYL